MTGLVLALGAYLVGSISFSYLAVWLVHGRDIRELGSGNAGATNVLRTTGLTAALAVLLLDIAKGAAPVLLALGAGAGPAVASATALAAVLGHVFPIYLRFRGGKGVATALGALAALALWPTVVAVGVILLLISWTRYVSLGSIVGVTLAPVLIVLWDADAWRTAAAAAIGLVVIARHSENLRRLRTGNERRLGERVEVEG